MLIYTELSSHACSAELVSCVSINAMHISYEYTISSVLQLSLSVLHDACSSANVKIHLQRVSHTVIV
eukprot:15076-Heterococcus_DN1.PRE.6